MSDLVAQFIPSHPGLLPKWMLFISVVSLFNSAQTYVSGIKLTQRVYEGNPQQVTPLSARTFGTWTVLASIVRLYAAYHISNSAAYDIALSSYLLAGFHFGTEWLVFGTAKFGKGLLGPLVVASSSIVWMASQRNYYLGL